MVVTLGLLFAATMAGPCSVDFIEFIFLSFSDSGRRQR
jgi:hypothetical protein